MFDSVIPRTETANDISVYYFYNPSGQHSGCKESRPGSSSPPFRLSLQGICDDNSQGSTCKQKLGSQSMSRLKNEANLQREKVRSCFPEETNAGNSSCAGSY